MRDFCWCWTSLHWSRALKQLVMCRSSATQEVQSVSCMSSTCLRNQMTFLGFFSVDVWKRFLPSRRGYFTLNGRRTTSVAVLTSLPRGMPGAVMTATSNVCGSPKARQSASVLASVHVLFRPRVSFLQLTWFGMEDVSPANGVRGDVSGLHMFFGSRRHGWSQQVCMFFLRTDAP